MGSLPHASAIWRRKRAWDGVGLVWTRRRHGLQQIRPRRMCCSICTATGIRPQGADLAHCRSRRQLRAAAIHLPEYKRGGTIRDLTLSDRDGRNWHRLDRFGRSSPILAAELPKAARCRGTDDRLARGSRHSKAARMSEAMAPCDRGTQQYASLGVRSQQDGQPAVAIARSRCFGSMGYRSRCGTDRRISHNSDCRARFLDRNSCSRGVYCRSVSVAGSRRRDSVRAVFTSNGARLD